jgi:hypothetical protein
VRGVQKAETASASDCNYLMTYHYHPGFAHILRDPGCFVHTLKLNLCRGSGVRLMLLRHDQHSIAIALDVEFQIFFYSGEHNQFPVLAVSFVLTARSIRQGFHRISTSASQRWRRNLYYLLYSIVGYVCVILNWW